MNSDLDPLAPDDAMEMWLERQQATKADETIQSYRYRLEQFVNWCDQQRITNLNDLTERDVFRFDNECRSDDLSVSTLNNRLGTLKLFLAFCQKMNAVTEDVVTAVDVPPLDVETRVDDEMLNTERAKTILDWLDTYRYGSREHALFALAWHTGCRLGGLRALDLGDVFLTEDDLPRIRHYPEVSEQAFEALREEIGVPFVYFRHRPDTGTPLKNGVGGRRPVALNDETAEVLRAYIKVNRVETTDDHGRTPLFSSEKGTGRLSKSAIRRSFYIVTQPCRFGADCPHGRDIETCEAREHGLESRCPSSRSPHPIRSGSITDHRDRGWPPEDVAERVNATPEVIRAHYDHPQLLKRMQSRRRFIDGGEDE